MTQGDRLYLQRKDFSRSLKLELHREDFEDTKFQNFHTAADIEFHRDSISWLAQLRLMILAMAFSIPKKCDMHASNRIQLDR